MLSEVNALELIRNRFSKLNSKDVFLGIGDDCAAFEIFGSNLIITSTDSMVEDVHFNTDLISPAVLALKSVSVSISDIAAMGGIPKFFLSTIGFTNSTDEEFISNFLDGFNEACELYKIDLIGGNITSSEKFFVDITVIGEVEKDFIVRRSGAEAGDLIFITGTPGDSATGLKLLQNGLENQFEYLIERHLSPTPRLIAGRKLAEAKTINSMIDVSDGLLIDLERITVDYGLGAEVFLEKIPVSPEYENWNEKNSESKFELALTGGEDYELLFTTYKDNRDKVLSIFNDLNLDVSEIGIVTNSGDLQIKGEDGKSLKFEERGFIHKSN